MRQLRKRKQLVVTKKQRVGLDCLNVSNLRILHERITAFLCSRIFYKTSLCFYIRYHMLCRWYVSLGRTSTESCHTTMEHSLAPTDFSIHLKHISFGYVQMKMPTNVFVPEVPFLDCGFIFILLDLEATTAAVPSKGIRLHVKNISSICRTFVVVRCYYSVCYIFSSGDG